MKIEWTGRTWNPWTGCSLVSPGCRHCYAMRLAARLAKMGRAGHAKYSGVTRPTAAGPVWSGRIGVGSQAEMEAPLSWPASTIFVCSMSDFFHEEVGIETRMRAWEIMTRARQHTFQVLTKRPRQALEFFERVGEAPDHIWVGVTIEDRRRAIERLPLLRRIPSRIRWISAEPLLEDLELEPADLDGIAWVVTGGESGPRARRCHPNWVTNLIRTARAAGARVFHKQWGNWRNHPLVLRGVPLAEAKRLDPSPPSKGGAGLLLKSGRLVLVREFPE